MKRLRHHLEYAAARLALFGCDRLPLSVVEPFCSGLGRAWFAADRRRRDVAVANILRSRITTCPGQARRIAAASFRHFAVLIGESLRFDILFNEQNWQDNVTFDIPAETRALLDAPEQGVLLVSGHVGNWEVAARSLAFLKPVVGITRDLNNPYTNTLMQQRKSNSRFRLTPKHHASSTRLLSVLSRGEMLALLIDQHAQSRGMMINFFGMPASTHTSPALLHLITRVPLCFGYCVRTGPMTYLVKAEPPMRFKPTGKRQDDVRAILTALTAKLEAVIRAYPEQYLWAHRRWRHQPAEGKAHD